MNYLAEIKSFFNWVMLNRLQPDAQALWHALMEINNRNAVQINGEWFWKCEFSVPNSAILSLLPFSRQQLDRMRNILIQTGRIAYRKGKGNQSGIYKMIPFDSSLIEDDNLWKTNKNNFVSHIVAQPVTQVVTQPDTQIGHKCYTNADLCNIFGTYINYINSKYNNIIYNKLLSDVDDEFNARACEEIQQKISTVVEEAVLFSERIFKEYFGRTPKENDIKNILDRIIEANENDICVDKDKMELTELAFEKAADNDICTWNYVKGILMQFNQRNITNMDEYWLYEAERDIQKGRI